jgi:hypothetical protein
VSYDHSRKTDSEFMSRLVGIMIKIKAIPLWFQLLPLNKSDVIPEVTPNHIKYALPN